MDEYISRESAAKALMTHRGLTPIARLEAATTVCHVPAADVVPWDWLKKFAEGKRYNYLSDFLIEAKVVFYRELVKETNDDSID